MRCSIFLASEDFSDTNLNSEDLSDTNLNSFFENGKFYVLCKVVDDRKLAPAERKIELFVLHYRSGL